MNIKELKLVIGFLEQLSDKMRNAGCNDWDFPKDWTHEERYTFVKEFCDLNGDPEEFDPERLILHDYCAVGLLKYKLRMQLKEQS